MKNVNCGLLFGLRHSRNRLLRGQPLGKRQRNRDNGLLSQRVMRHSQRDLRIAVSPQQPQRQLILDIRRRVGGQRVSNTIKITARPESNVGHLTPVPADLVEA